MLSAGLQETADDPLTLSALIEALGKIGNLETLEELRRHLGDVEGELRLMLLDSIVRVAERYAEPLLFNKSLCTDLIKGLHSDDENIRLSCAKGLSIFRGASITRPLIQALHGDGALEKFLVGHLITRPETFALCVEALDEPACTEPETDHSTPRQDRMELCQYVQPQYGSLREFCAHSTCIRSGAAPLGDFR